MRRTENPENVVRIHEVPQQWSIVQLVECRSPKPKVGGSNPPAPANDIIDPIDARKILALGIAALLNKPFPQQQFGVFRM